MMKTKTLSAMTEKGLDKKLMSSFMKMLMLKLSILNFQSAVFLGYLHYIRTKPGKSLHQTSFFCILEMKSKLFRSDLSESGTI